MGFEGHVGLEVVNLCVGYDDLHAKTLSGINSATEITHGHTHRITALISKMRALEEKARSSKKNVFLDEETRDAVYAFEQTTWRHVEGLLQCDDATALQLHPFPASAPPDASFSAEDLTKCIERLQYLFQVLGWELEDNAHKVRDAAAKAQAMPLITVAIATHLGKEQEAMVRGQITR